MEGAGDAWAVGPVEGDGDRVGGVCDVAAEVEQVAQDRPVLVGVAQVGVEVLGQPGFGLLPVAAQLRIAFLSRERQGADYECCVIGVCS